MKGSSDIPRDIEKGLSMFRLAVEQNYKAATRDLARYYYSLETEEDNRKALDYYLQYIEYNPKDTDTLLHNRDWEFRSISTSPVDIMNELPNKTKPAWHTTSWEEPT